MAETTGSYKLIGGQTVTFYSPFAGNAVRADTRCQPEVDPPMAETTGSYKLLADKWQYFLLIIHWKLNRIQNDYFTRIFRQFTLFKRKLIK